MKKALLIITCLLLMICLSGCGGKKIKTEAEMQADLAASQYLPEKGLTISNFVVEKRKTDIEDKLDTVYVSFYADNEHVRYVLSCTLTYELYNDGWLLTKAKTTSKSGLPLTGISDEKLAAYLDGTSVYASQNEFNNAKLVSRNVDLANMEETLIYQCSRTMHAQKDTWTTTMKMYFDTEDCRWYRDYSTVSDFNTTWDFSKVAGDYHYSYNLSPYITLDVTVTPDGRFYYDASYKRRAAYIGAKETDFQKSGVAFWSDFQKKYVSPGFNNVPDEFEFGYVFFVGEGNDQVGIVLYEGQVYRGDSGDADGIYLSNWDWDPEQDYNGGGWGEDTW